MFEDAAARRLPAGWDELWRTAAPVFEAGTSVATREAQGKILDAVMPKLPMVIGGSADLTPSNNTRFKGVTDFSRENRSGRYLRFGVREHAMGAILNGIAVSDLLVPYGATFFCFVDYMRAAVRLAALSRYPSIFVYTHDSIGLGEDGPTHQAVEHFASLRAMPGLIILRPADANETTAAWKFALEHRSGPVVLALTRQKLPVVDRRRCAPAGNLVRGAYTLCEGVAPKVILIGTGSEVSLALAAHDTLAAQGISSRVVSMPSWELFEQQPASYRDEILPSSITARVAVEAGVPMGWERYMGPQGIFIGIHTFGTSAPYEIAYRHFGITADAVVAAARRTLV
jgi:transketolase